MPKKEESKSKREICEIDGDGFISQFSNSAVKEYRAPKDVPPSAPPESDRPPEKEKKARPAKQITNDWFDCEDEDVIQRFQILNMTDDEIDFIKDYVVKTNFTQVSQKGKAVVIREKHRKRIKSIFELLGEDTNMAAYIDNVLTEHFKKYYPTIMGIAKKCPSKF